MAERVQYIVPGKSSIAGHTHDIAGLISMLRRGKELSGGTLQLDLRSVVADDHYLFVYGRIHAEREGRATDVLQLTQTLKKMETAPGSGGET